MSSLEKLFRIVDIGPNAENKEEVFEESCMFIFLSFFFLGFKYLSYLTFAPGSQVPKVLGGEGRASQI